jgi:membrane-associated protease RseP (regulator of RpoE activity)
MNGIWYYVIAFILIWIFALIFKDYLTNHGVEVEFPILMWKTKRLRGFIDKVASKSKKFWKWYMNLGIIVSFGFMIFMVVALIYSFTNLTQTPAVGLVIPGVDVPGSPIFIPFVSGIIALITVIVVHEFSHGILARVENVKINSIGLLLFAIIPGAFVEPDEKEINELSKAGKLRIYAAGSMGNLMLALISIILVLILSAAVVPMAFHEDGVSIDRIVSDAPADGILKSGMIIESINNQSFNNSEGYANVIKTFKPNDTVQITTDQGDYSFKLGENPNNKSLGYMGVQAVKHYSFNQGVNNNFLSSILWCLFPLIQVLTWIFFLNFAIGTFNLLPMKPLDGGLMFETLLSYKLPDNIVKILTSFSTYLMLIIIVVSLFYGIGSALF